MPRIASSTPLSETRRKLSKSLPRFVLYSREETPEKSHTLTETLSAKTEFLPVELFAGCRKRSRKSEISSLGRHAIAGKAGGLSSRAQKFPPPGESRSFGSGQPFVATRREVEGPTVSLFPDESRSLPRPRRLVALRSTLHTKLSGRQALLHCFS